jgi:hypothetical protein
MPRTLIPPGTIFGRLTVIESICIPGQTTRCRCRCTCGNEKMIRAELLTSGRTKACGCQRIRHGQSLGGKASKTLRAWHNMIQRCYNPKARSFSYCGARGITVCPEWRRSFTRFLWDMGQCPPSLTLERVNNNGPYCKENCCWASPKTQGRNRRTNVIFTVNGVTGCLAELCEHWKVPRNRVQSRLNKGWPIALALTFPRMHRGRGPAKAKA